MIRKPRGLWVAEYRALGSKKWNLEGVFKTAKEARTMVDNLRNIGFTQHTRITRYVKA